MRPIYLKTDVQKRPTYVYIYMYVYMYMYIYMEINETYVSQNRHIKETYVCKKMTYQRHC